VLKKLLDGFSKSDAIDVKVRKLLIEAQKIPETKEELMKLVRYATVNPILNNIPDVNVDAIHIQLKSCKQILVATDNYYYI
jgi:hypothetical protein